ncbi:MAG: hypothetical protein RIG84_20370 [Roseovarius sp.]
MTYHDDNRLVTRRGAVFGALLGVPAAALAVVLAAQPAKASGDGPPKKDKDDDGCKGGDCEDD